MITFLLTVMFVSAFRPAQIQPRMIIATGVACRASADPSAPVVIRYELGQIFAPQNQTQARDGMWYLATDRVRGASPGCWIYGPLTTESADRERALLTAADRMLARTDRVPLVEFVALDNLLLQTQSRAHSDSSALQRSPILQLRRLQLLDRASRAPDAAGHVARRDPWKSAWFYANRDVLRYFEPAGRWVVTADAYWRLYERHQATPIAEDIAWAAAQGMVPGDECDAPCILDRINRTYARYWAAYPRGRHLNEALSAALTLADHAARGGCFGGDANAVRPLANQIQTTLNNVTAPQKPQLLTLLADTQRRCGVR